MILFPWLKKNYLLETNILKKAKFLFQDCKITTFHKLTNMDEEPISITCRNCKTTYPFNRIVRHVNQSECSTTYSQEQVESLRMHSNEITSAKHRIKMSERHHQKYDPIERGKNYQNKTKGTLVHERG